MNLEIQYLKKADKFFVKNGSILSKEKSKELIIKSVKKILLKEDVNVDLKQLKGNLQNYYRIRFGKVRILFELINHEIKIVTIVNDIDFRGDVYK
jgi:mRNA-degrading endonuclease RelE of RelBE toxin-antitoxin system